MIVSYKNKDTQNYFDGKEVRKFNSVDRELAYKRFDYLDSAQKLSDIPPLKSIHLQGKRKGQWAFH